MRESFPDLTRLPNAVTPKRYELKLEVDLVKQCYKGRVNIRIHVQKDTDGTIWLHSKNLDISSAYLQVSHFALPIEAQEIIHVPEKSCIGLSFPSQTVKKNLRAWLLMSFEGRLSQNLEGFFCNPYTDEDGNVQVGAATMFAATEARSCFPCFDEPHLKAIFAIEVTVDSDLMVISNMPLMDSEAVTSSSSQTMKKRRDIFEWTKEMSTYLVCIVIGKYDFVQTKAHKTKIRIYTPFAQREQGRYSLQVAKKCLEFFNSYFGKNYPLPKLDLVALRRLSVGAMENWGLITCRENALIVDPQDASPSTLRRIATLIAHEISHQWFGNLVTMTFWDCLYLNEGFATFMQYLAIDSIYPEFEVFNEFSTETFVPALGMDALENSHAIEVTLKDASEISQVFDKITYCKGASVIYMLHQFMGPERFKSGIREYISNFSYGNASSDDLWHFLSQSCSSQLDVRTMMECWIKEMGYPVVFVEVDESDQNRGSVTLRFCQQRFSGGRGRKRSSSVLWNIPIQGIYMKDGIHLEKFEFLFDKKTTSIELDGIDLTDPSCWIKINPGLTGFYRVHYSEQLFHRLFDNLSNVNLTCIDRMGLFDDQVAMIQTETGSTLRLLQMAKHFSKYERSYTVWRAVISILHLIRSLTWENDQGNIADKIDSFCISILKPFLDELGFHGRSQEPNSDKQCRSALFGYLATLGEAEVQRAAREMFQKHTEGTQLIGVGMKDAVYKAVMTGASTRQTFNQMKSLYRNAELAEEKNRILHAIGFSQNPDILQKVLEFAISLEVPPQDSIVTLASVASNRYGYQQAWSFFSNNIQKISKRYAGGLFLMAKLLKALTENFSSMEAWQEINQVFANHKDLLIGAETACQQATERVRLNHSWRSKDIANLSRFLDSDQSL